MPETTWNALLLPCAICSLLLPACRRCCHCSSFFRVYISCVPLQALFSLLLSVLLFDMCYARIPRYDMKPIFTHFTSRTFDLTSFIRHSSSMYECRWICSKFRMKSGSGSIQAMQYTSDTFDCFKFRWCLSLYSYVYDIRGNTQQREKN